MPVKQYKIDDFTTTTRVKHLVAALLALDQEKFVYTEGCDCIGNVVDVSIDTDGSVIIERDDRSMREGVLKGMYKDFFDDTNHN